MFLGTRSQPSGWVSVKMFTELAHAVCCTSARTDRIGRPGDGVPLYSGAYEASSRFLGHRVGSLHWLVWCWDLYADPHFMYIDRRWWSCGGTYFGTSGLAHSYSTIPFVQMGLKMAWYMSFFELSFILECQPISQHISRIFCFFKKLFILNGISRPA